MSASLGSILKKLREKKGLTLRELKSLSGVSYSYLSQLENDTVSKNGKVISPTLEILIRISKGLDMPLGEFLALTGYAENDFIQHGSPVSSIKKESDIVSMLAYYAKVEKKDLTVEEYETLEEFARKWWKKHPLPKSNPINITDTEFSFIEKYRALDDRGKDAVNETLEREYKFALK